MTDTTFLLSLLGLLFLTLTGAILIIRKGRRDAKDEKIFQSVIIVTDRLPLQKDKQNLVKALKKGIKEYLGRHALACRYDIFHHCSASSANLQIIDYISWAIFRK